MLALTTNFSKLEVKTYVLAKVQVVGGNITQTRTNTKVRDSNKIYFEGLYNLEYWRVKPIPM